MLGNTIPKLFDYIHGSLNIIYYHTAGRDIDDILSFSSNQYIFYLYHFGPSKLYVIYKTHFRLSKVSRDNFSIIKFNNRVILLRKIRGV